MNLLPTISSYSFIHLGKQSLHNLFVFSELIPYKVKVKTGDTLEADTDAKVHINFHGTYGETGKGPLILMPKFTSTSTELMGRQVRDL